METLTEQDLDWLTKVENRLMRMRKREAYHTKSAYLIDYISETIGKCHIVRQILQGRFGVREDKDLDRL